MTPVSACAASYGCGPKAGRLGLTSIEDANAETKPPGLRVKMNLKVENAKFTEMLI